MSATFGALKGAQLKLQPGLNIIQSPNEAGKSTWCAFIRAMLYGINTAERSKEGVLAEKTKYRPWTGDAMEGRMEIETEDGQAITIQRTALGTSPMRRIDVRYAGTGEQVLTLMHENLGEVLTGVPEAVFVRSAFIRQADVKVTQTGPLEERIKSLISSGEEEVNYGQTVEKLKKWLNRRRSQKKTGEIPQIQAELLEMNQTLARLQEASAAYNELSLQLDQARHRTEQLAQEQAAHIELERRAQRQKIADQRRQVENLQWEIATLQKQLTKQDGIQLSDELVRTAQETYDELRTANMRYTAAKEAWEQAEKDLSLIEEEKANTPFAGKDMDGAKALANDAAAVDAAAEKATNYNKSVYGIPLAVLPVVALGSLTVTQMVGLALWPLSIVSVIGAALAGLLFFRKWSIAKQKEAKRTTLFTLLNVPDIETLQTALADYEFLSQKAEELRHIAQETDQASGLAMLEMQELRSKFETAAHTFAPAVEGLEEAALTLTEMGQVVDRLETAEKELKTAQTWQETLEAGYEGDPHAPIPQDGLAPPAQSKSKTAYALRHMEQELDTLKHRFALGQGEVRALGDPVVLGARHGALTDRLTELTRQYSALQLAMEVLGEADSEISARFSPLLGQKAGYYLDRLTDGAYKRVLFDKTLTPSVERGEESISRDILYLSGGTVDQVYLALRLAICDLTFPKEQACPIILDDALVSFDENRMKQALVLLKELAAERQVLLFTCHDREAAFFDGTDGVNLIRL